MRCSLFLPNQGVFIFTLSKSAANRKAWEVVSRFDKPFLTAFGDSDPITHRGERIFQKRVPGAEGQPHTTIKGGGHFLQEDCPEEFAEVVVDFIDQKQRNR
jgi:haloalkane dehalogenase